MIKELVVEKICKNKEHNGFIKSYLETFHKEKFYFYGEKHLVNNILNESFSGGKPVCLNNPSFFNILSFILNNKNIKLTFLSSNISILIFSIICSKFKNVKSIKIIPHAILNQVYYDSLDFSFKGKIKKRFPFIRYAYWLKKSLRIEKIETIVLGRSIFKNLQNIISGENNLKWIHHPYNLIFDQNKYFEKSDIINIGFVGIGSKDKGFPELLDFLKNDQDFSNSLSFYHVGPSKKISYFPDSNLKQVFADTSLINKVEFEDKIKEMDYLIFPFPESEYKLRASGSFFDAIKYEKPIIYRKNDFINDYIDMYGSIGIEVNFNNSDLNMLKEVISLEDYDSLINNIKKIKLDLLEEMKQAVIHEDV